MNKICTIYNYADDNTILCTGNNVSDVRNKMENALQVLIQWFNNNSMKVNPDKFQVIFFDRKNSCANEYLMINNIKIVHQPTVKLLGMYIDCKLNFDEHVREICRKAGFKLNVLARLSKTLDEEAKLLLFHSFILSYFKYCCPVWVFCDLPSIRVIEKIQERALRFVYNDFRSTYSDLCAKSGISLLCVQRLRSLLEEVHKCVKKEGPCYMHALFMLKQNKYCLKNEISLELPHHDTVRYGFQSMRYFGAKLYNSLSYDLKSHDTTKFKKMIKCWYPSECNCLNSSCILCKIQQNWSP